MLSLGFQHQAGVKGEECPTQGDASIPSPPQPLRGWGISSPEPLIGVGTFPLKLFERRLATQGSQQNFESAGVAERGGATLSHSGTLK